MALIKYDYNYNFHEAYSSFKVDTEKLTAENAKMMLKFFSWNYDEEADPVDQLMLKYGMKAIEIATAENYNTYGVQEWFNETEGFLALDGSQGIELLNVSRYEFDEDNLSLETKIL